MWLINKFYDYYWNNYKYYSDLVNKCGNSTHEHISIQTKYNDFESTVAKIIELSKKYKYNTNRLSFCGNFDKEKLKGKLGSVIFNNLDFYDNNFRFTHIVEDGNKPIRRNLFVGISRKPTYHAGRTTMDMHTWIKNQGGYNRFTPLSVDIWKNMSIIN